MSKEKQPKKLPKVNILSDLPSDSDAFGPHQSIADALYRIFSTESGNKAIALVGSWGSGKSTVIKLLSKIVKPKEESVFLFDAWSHEGDPLRRSFLEQLIEHLISVGWTTEKRWEAKKDEIAKRREESETIVSPGLSEYGKGLAISALFVPAGLALMSKHGFFFDNPPNFWIEILPVVLTFLPFIIGGALWLRMRPWQKVFGKGFLSTNRAPYEDESFYSILKTGSTEITKNVTSKTPDPTSLEFNNFFTEILEDVLDGNNKKLIIVMDNLDRIAPETAMNIWSTMRVFFDESRNSHQEFKKRFWLIVPFDSKAIQSLWERDSSSEQPINFAKSFIDKSFQLTFHVSPPVLSDWKEFLFNQLKKAFPEHEETEFHGVYRLYLLSDREPGPREMKIFVNEIGEIYRQWGLEIPFILQAGYVLNRTTDQDKINDRISDGSFFDESFKNVIGNTDWQKYIAAIYFNVDLDKAIQVLIRPQIEKAFAGGNAKRIENIRKVPAFEENCENLINDSLSDWVKEEPTTIALTALVLNDLKVVSSPAAQRAWADLRRGIPLVSAWKGLEPKSAKGIDLILRSSPPEKVDDLVKSILSSIVSLKPSTKDEKVSLTPEWAEHATDSISIILDTMIVLGKENLVKEYFHVPGDANAYIEALRKIGSSRPSENVLKAFASKEPESSIRDALVNLINNGNFTEDHFEVIKSLHQIGFSDWNNIASSIETRLDPGTNLNAGQSRGLVRTLLYLSQMTDNKNVEKSLRNSVAQSKIAHHLRQYNSEKRFDSQAVAVLPIMLFKSAGTNEPNVGNSKAGYNHYNQVRSNPENFVELVKEIANLVKEFGLIEKLLDFVNDGNLNSLAKTVLQELVVARSIEDTLSINLVLERVKDFETAFSNDDFKIVVKKLSNNDKFYSEIIEHGFTQENQKIYRFLFDSESALKNKNLTDFVKKGLKSVEEDEWKSQLNSNGDLVFTGIGLTKAGINLDLEDSLADPLLEITKQHRNKETLPGEFTEEWPTIISFLTYSFKETFLRDIVSDLSSRPKVGFDSVIELLGDVLKTSDVISENADQFFRSLGKEVLDKDSLVESELYWLSELFSENEKVSNNVKSATKDTLKKRISTLLKKEDLENGVEQALQELNSNL